MTTDQIIWIALAAATSAVLIPVCIALFRGWTPRWIHHPFAPRRTGIGLAIAGLGTWIGAAPNILAASDQAVVRCANIAFGLGILGFAVQFTGTLRRRTATRQR